MANIKIFIRALAMIALVAATTAYGEEGSEDRLAAGGYHTCARLDNGMVKCWGYNTYGQLGLGDTNSRGDAAGEMGYTLPAVALGTGRTAVALAVGSYHTCARLDNGTVKCWGNNTYGQLGLGDTNHRGDAPSEMGDALPAVALGTGRTAVALIAGDNHTCARLDNGAVKCWGYNTFGQLGLGDTNHRGDVAGEMGDALPAVALGTGRTAVELVAGGGHTCARLDNGAVKCWGFNTSGQLGLGDTNRRDVAGEMGDALPAVALGTGRTAVALAAGSYHTCARLDNGTVKCWGNNTYGQLGLGDTYYRGDAPSEMGDALPTVALGTGRTAVGLTAGYYHTCARLDNGAVKCWGNNADGELGLGDINHRGDVSGEMGDTLPTVTLGTGRTAVELTAGGRHTCARLDNGAVKCWGYNAYGQLGVGDINHRGDIAGEMGDALPVVALGTGRTAVGLAAGFYHTCARLNNGTVKCWGNNTSGQLGVGDTNPRGDGPGEMGDALPSVALGTGRTAVGLTAGDSHTCARLNNGTVKCWGSNRYGQLGLGDINHRGDVAGEMGDALPAVALGTGRTAIALEAGDHHTCARLDNGTVKCWGANTEGQLGLGDINRRGDVAGEMGDALPAVALGTGRTAVELTAGSSHTCARLDNGAVKCWGSNTYGQLGLGDTNHRGDVAGEMGDALPAVALGTGRTAVGLAAGYYHTCARLDNGAVKCWGLNGLGQLGLGDRDHRGDVAGEMGDALPAVALGTGRTAVGLAVSYSHTCARLDNGAVKCWGNNFFGQLGLGDTNPRGDGAGEMGDALPAIALGTGRTAVELTAGYSHTCARLDNGAVKCWGYNHAGQLGLGDTNSRGDAPDEMGDMLLTVDLGGF